MKNKVLVLALLTILFTSCYNHKPVIEVKKVIVDADIRYQSIDGFGVNINPALWNNGKLKPALDLLVDELGSTQIRFDCYGRANWLDPKKRLANGTWPVYYLSEIYSSPDFTNAWLAFRYLNEKGIEPYFNVSGIVPAEWNEPGTKILKDFDAYAEMICTMLEWARNKENLKFSMLAPVNETDYDGSREGPAIPAVNRIKALNAIVNALKNHKLTDIKLAVYCDGFFENSKIQPILNDSSFTKIVSVMSAHWYGSGDEGDGEGWYTQKSNLGKVLDFINNSVYKGTHIWLNEYGDLDQSNEIETEFSWRITRRLFKSLSDGANSCQFWDAYDNYHKHDSAWTTYGLLETDTVKMQFLPRKRFYASKQVYKFVKPGFIRTGIIKPQQNSYDVYSEWRNPIKNIKMQAFVSPNNEKLTIVGLSLVEKASILEISLKNFNNALKGKMALYLTNNSDNCKLVGFYAIENDKIKVPLSGKTIFTITNIE